MDHTILNIISRLGHKATAVNIQKEMLPTRLTLGELSSKLDRLERQSLLTSHLATNVTRPDKDQRGGSTSGYVYRLTEAGKRQRKSA